MQININWLIQISTAAVVSKFLLCLMKNTIDSNAKLKQQIEVIVIDAFLRGFDIEAIQIQILNVLYFGYFSSVTCI